MSWSYLPRWKFTDSCGRPRVAGVIHIGCTHSGHTQRAPTTRRGLLKSGVAIVSAAGTERSWTRARFSHRDECFRLRRRQ